MNGWMEWIALNLLRTTLVTCVAALASMAFLALLRIRNPKLHRLTWALVLLQGWLVATYVWQIEVDLPRETGVVATLAEVSLTYTTTGQMAAELPVAESTKPFEFTAFAWRVSLLAWSLGGFALVAIGLARYVRLFVSARPGDVPKEPDWLSEWKQVCDSSSLRGRVEIRITRDLGPLVCWVPRVFLVLVPRKLWSRLAARDRLFILRHELAHCERGDLWKNLALRMLALPQWFNPLVWLAVRRFEEAGEWACDERVARATGEASTHYASTLVRVADFASQVPCGAVGVTGGELTRRVKRLLDLPNKEVREMRGIILPILLLAVGLLQTIRIECVEADEPVVKATAPQGAAEVAKPPKSNWSFDQPYTIEPPDILRIDFAAGGQRNAGQHLVGPDGGVNLGSYGNVTVVGMTIEEARTAIEEQLKIKLDTPEVIVEVAAYNSKVYYVISHGNGLGDRVERFHITGNETVLDALAQTQDDHPLSRSTRVWIVRPAPNGIGSDQILPVSIPELFSGADPSTNHMLWPADRLHVVYQKQQQTAGPPDAVERVNEHPIAASRRRLAAATDAEIQRWGVQLAGDTAVLRVSSNTEHKFVIATIASLQKAGTDKFTLRLFDPNDETDIAASAFSIHVTDGAAEITGIAEMPHEFLDSLISQLKDAGITKMEFADPNDFYGTSASQR